MCISDTVVFFVIPIFCQLHSNTHSDTWLAKLFFNISCSCILAKKKKEKKYSDITQLPFQWLLISLTFLFFSLPHDSLVSFFFFFHFYEIFVFSHVFFCVLLLVIFFSFLIIIVLLVISIVSKIWVKVQKLRLRLFFALHWLDSMALRCIRHQIQCIVFMYSHTEYFEGNEQRTRKNKWIRNF